MEIIYTFNPFHTFANGFEERKDIEGLLNKNKALDEARFT